MRLASLRQCSLSIAIVLAGLCLPVARAQVSLPHVFSDHAVLQRDKPIHIWGWSPPSDTITVKLHGQSFITSATREGLWEVYLRPEPAGGPYTLDIRGSAGTDKTITFSDILIGDVWIASGQSNMEFPMTGFSEKTPMKNSAAEIAAANHPNIRMLVQPREASFVPQYDQHGIWEVCTPQNAPHFSAVAYFFGRNISENEHVPIGLIDTTWGGTPVQAWISSEGIAYSNLASVANDGSTVVSQQGRNEMLRNHYAELTKDGLPNIPKGIRGDHQNSWNPSALFNGMIAPYVPLAIKGAIWYQGEADSSPVRAAHYAQVFPALIADWRRQFAQGDFPFLYVQLASPSRAAEFGEVRDAQRRTLDLRNTGMAVTLDIGMQGNVHPPDKETVGDRLAASASQFVYGKHKEGTSPLFVETTTEGATMRVWLSHADGLKPGKSGIGEFEIADEKGVFHPADAKIEVIGNNTTIAVTSSEVKQPTAVRYGWAGYVTHYLYNSAGLPLTTFTSERIPANALN